MIKIIKKSILLPLLKYIANRYSTILTQNIRSKLNQDIVKYYDGVIQSGIFKGKSILPFANSWSITDLGTIVLGIYEIEVQNFIKKHIKNNSNIVFMGAADGYFAINSVLSFNINSAICYELTTEGRKNIKKNAEHFNISDKLIIKNKIDNNNIHELFDQSIDLILCDIEGAEFDIFEEPILEKLKNSKIIIEIHSKNIDNYDNKLNNLISNASKFFHVDELFTGPRDLSKFVYLKDVPDDKRWIICSEGRSKLGKWLTLTPKK